MAIEFSEYLNRPIVASLVGALVGALIASFLAPWVQSNFFHSNNVNPVYEIEFSQNTNQLPQKACEKLYDGKGNYCKILSINLVNSSEEDLDNFTLRVAIEKISPNQDVGLFDEKAEFSDQFFEGDIVKKKLSDTTFDLVFSRFPRASNYRWIFIAENAARIKVRSLDSRIELNDTDVLVLTGSTPSSWAAWFTTFLAVCGALIGVLSSYVLRKKYRQKN